MNSENEIEYKITNKLKLFKNIVSSFTIKGFEHYIIEYQNISSKITIRKFTDVLNNTIKFDKKEL